MWTVELILSRNSISIAAAVICALSLSACGSFKDSNYGFGPQAQQQLMAQAAADKEPVPDSAGVYLNLITRMQTQGLYFASLAHIDSYEKQYGAIPETILLRGDALRETGQPVAAKLSYNKLLRGPLAAEGHHGLGLLAGGVGDFATADTEFTQAVALAPTNATMLSDLAYARMRGGNIASARVPLLKAAELDQKSAKIMSNLALYMYASGHAQSAQAFMTREKFPPEVRAAVLADVPKIEAAEHAGHDAVNQWAKSGGKGMATGTPGLDEAAKGAANTMVQAPINTIDTQTVLDLPAPMLERFAPMSH